MKEVSFDVIQAIHEVFPSDDPLDREDFNVIDYINRSFPDEPSLSDLEPFRNGIKKEMNQLEDELSYAIQEQSRLRGHAVNELKEAKQAIQQLFGQIQEIGAKADTSEVMVQEICRDIKQLDNAKKHLHTTINAMKKLHMLVTAVDQLKLMASTRKYREAANLLEAVKGLFTLFDDYRQIGKIKELQDKVQAIREDLANQIFGDFGAVGSLADVLIEDNMATMFDNLAAACAVIDALGPTFRMKLIASFCADQLLPYNKTFGKGGEAYALECADRRYPWFYRLLRTLDDRMDKVFPKLWQMSRRLAIAFCEKTRAHLLVQLGEQNPDDIDVTHLLKALQKTLMFEKDMLDRFELNASLSSVDKNQKNKNKNKNKKKKSSSRLQLNKDDGMNGKVHDTNNSNSNTNEDEDVEDEDVEDEDEDEEMLMDDHGEWVAPGSAYAVRLKYMRKRQQKEAELRKREAAGYVGHVDEIDFVSFHGIVSNTFDPFMTSYVALERKNMEKMIQEEVSIEKVDREGPLPVFSSSVNMFVYIRSSVKRCTALTKGQTFFNLHKEFKTCLRQYAQQLSAKLPKSTLNVGILVGEVFRLEVKQEDEICFVINTAEYCAETFPSLEEAIRSKIDSAYVEAIDLSDEVDCFQDVAALAMKCLVSGLEVKCESFLGAIPKMPWSSWENVGDQSDYILQIAVQLEAYIPTLRDMLSELYYTNFCDKFAASFLPRYLQMVLKCKRINEMGTQQLLLDTHSMKTLFLQLPNLGKKEDGESTWLSSSQRYAKLVNNEIAKTETVLKLIGTPFDMLVASFKILWPQGTPEDLQQIMAVKGLKKQEQQQLLETLGIQRMGGKSLHVAHASNASNVNSSNATTASSHGMSSNLTTGLMDTSKMMDMTENLKKNMQNFAKGSRFGFGS